MLYKGYKIRVRCIEWEQVDYLDKYWNVFTSVVGYENIIGLGMNWSDDYLYFDYALGVIDNEDTLKKISEIDFSNTGFDVKYIEIKLPDLNEWDVFEGKEDEIKQIYEEKIDCYNRSYDYELEYIDGKGNILIRIHFNDNNL